MAAKKEGPAAATHLNTGDVEEFISRLDKLHKEKPVGFFAYITACHSAMAIQNISSGTEETKRTDK